MAAEICDRLKKLRTDIGKIKLPGSNPNNEYSVGYSIGFGVALDICKQLVDGYLEND